MTSKYVNVKVNISDRQKDKIKNALQSGAEAVSIRFKPEDYTGKDLISITKTQHNKLTKACKAGKPATIKMGKTQIRYNMKMQGGFLPLLAGLAAKALPILTGTVLPALATGALRGWLPPA